MNQTKIDSEELQAAKFRALQAESKLHRLRQQVVEAEVDVQVARMQIARIEGEVTCG